MLAEVPDVIASGGRVAGFEYLRDRLLRDWEGFIGKGVNAYSALKLVIETDRHAMFAEVQAAKKKGETDAKMWENFQRYLHGEVEAGSADEPPEEEKSKPRRVKTYSPQNELKELKEEYDIGEDEN